MSVVVCQLTDMTVFKNANAMKTNSNHAVMSMLKSNNAVTKLTKETVPAMTLKKKLLKTQISTSQKELETK